LLLLFLNIRTVPHSQKICVLWLVLGVPSIATIFYFIFSFSHHYMFRHLQAIILRWNIYSQFLKAVYFTWGWPVEAETCSDVKRRIWNKKLSQLTAYPKQIIVTDETGCTLQRLKSVWCIYVMIFPCILVMRQQHILGLLSVYF
jgi:hypothetical protein